ncbi:PAS domain-containing protein [Myxococcaceae bacterium GXIMD 01537]
MPAAPAVSADVFEQMVECVALCTPEGRLLYVNPAAERLMGQSREHLLGEVWWARAPHPSTRAARERFERVARGGAPESVVYFHEALRCWLDVRFTRVPEGVFVLTRDITALKAAEDARDAALAREREARKLVEDRNDLLERAFSNAPLLMCMSRGADHRYVLVNASYRRMLGGRALLGRTIREALPEIQGQGLFELLDRVFRTGEPYIGREVPSRFVRHEGGELEEGFFTFVYQPMRGPEGRVDGILTVAFEVTELVRARQRAESLARALAASEAEAHAIVDTLQEAVVVFDAQGLVVKVNASAERLLGVDIAERAQVGHFWDEVRLDGSPLPTSEFPALVALRAGQPQSGVVLGVRGPEGRRVWLSVNAQPLRDAVSGGVRGAVASFTDITERLRVEESLRFLAEATVALSATLDSQDLLEKLSRLAVPRFADWCSIYLVKEGGESELAAVTSQPPAVAARVREMHERFPLPSESSHTYRGVLRTGKPVMVSPFTAAMRRAVARGEAHWRLLEELRISGYIAVPLTVGARTLGVIVFALREDTRVYDGHDLEVAVELGRRAAIAFEQARLFEVAQTERRRAEEASRLKDEFLATVSHELRTPLTAMLGWMQLLRGGRLSPEKRARAMATVERNAWAQAQLVEDLLDVSRIVTGKLRLEVVPMQLADAVRSAMEVVRPAAEARGVSLHAELDPEASPFMGDPQRLQQVVWNLLSNAVKFTPSGGRVDVELRREGDATLLRVRDTGQGIGKEFLPYVFERFRQAEGGTTRRHGGLGLGLSIVKHLVELHGGHVDVASDGESRGSLFTVWLPSAHARPISGWRGSEPRRASPALACAPQMTGLRVLVVDDEADVRELLTVLLEHCEARVRTASNASEAMDLLLRERVDVLVCDIGMPGEDGYAFIRRVRALPAEQGGQTPAVALTAYTRTQDRMKALLAGYQRHLSKPVRPEELIAALALLAPEAMQERGELC